jgi:hypothetical protein
MPAVATAAPTKTFSINATGQAKIVMYNEFTCDSPIDGAATLSGGAAYNNTGSLQSALNSGNFLGVKDMGIAFKDGAGNQEIYNAVTGVGSSEYTQKSKLSISLVNPNPHAGEYLIDSSGVRNPAIIDVYSDSVMMLDSDGSTSSYNTKTSALNVDYAYKSLSGGGNLNGVTMTDIASNPNFIGIGNEAYMSINNAGTGIELYSTVTGLYSGAWGTTDTFTGGPLVGVTVKQAVQNSHGVEGLKFVGVTDSDLSFYDSINKQLVYYELRYFTNTWSGSGGITTPYNGNLKLGAFAGSIDAAMSSGRFLGIVDSRLLFVDTMGQMFAYNSVNGNSVGSYPIQPLEGPQVKNTITQNLIDTVDEGNIYIDADGTTSVYSDTGALFLDQHWATFKGGEMDGARPTKDNIIAAEDFLLYSFDADGSLMGYNYIYGTAWSTDLWKCTSLSGGPLTGKNLKDAVLNKIAGVSFLGVSNDQLVFAYYTPKLLPVKPITEVSDGAIGTIVLGASTTKLSTGTTKVLGVTAPNTGIKYENSSVYAISVATGTIAITAGLLKKNAKKYTQKN